MASIGNYGSGPYRVSVSLGNGFGTDEVTHYRYEDAAQAAEAYRKHRREDGELAGQCPPVKRRTTRNRRLAEAMGG